MKTNEVPPCVAVLGAAAVDWVACVKEMPRRDSIVFADRYAPLPGGTGGNVAEALARLGKQVRFLGVLGDDEGGQVLLRAFLEAGVDTSAIRVEKDKRSAACFIAIDQHGARAIFALGGVALYEKAQDIDPAWLKGVQVLFIADAFPETAGAALDALETDARVVFAPGGLMASSGEAYLEPFLARAEVLIVSQGEAETMTGESNTERAAALLASRGPQVVMLTQGAQGVIILEKGTISRVNAVQVQLVVDTTGAGDAFAAGVIAGMLEGSSWVEAARLGCAVASIKIGQLGSRTGLPDQWQVQQLLESSRSTKSTKEVVV